MAGYNDSVKAMATNYANGTLVIKRENGKIEFSGATFECKDLIKDLADGKAKWNRENKTWTIDESDIRRINWNTLEEVTNGEITNS